MRDCMTVHVYTGVIANEKRENKMLQSGACEPTENSKRAGETIEKYSYHENARNGLHMKATSERAAERA